METWQLVLYGVASFVTAILSGISGGGGGFIMTPLAIFLGLTPAQSVATGKLPAFALTVGSIAGMKEVHGHISKRRVIPVMILAFAMGLLAPFIITTLNQELYRILLGILLLVMIPVVILKRVGVKPHHPAIWQKYVGSFLLAASMLLVGAFSGGLGTLVNLVLMGMLGMTALEANLTKRWSHIVLIATVTLGVLASGLIVWSIVPVGIITSLLGSYIGGKIAVKNGDVFVMKVMIGLMIVSAAGLIFG